MVIERPPDVASENTRHDGFAMRVFAAVGADIRRARSMHGWTQSILADQAGVSQATVSRIERGANPSGELIRLVMVMYALGATFPLGSCPHRHHCDLQPGHWAVPEPVADQAEGVSATGPRGHASPHAGISQRPD